MKKAANLLLLLLLFAVPALNAQDFSMMNRYRTAKVRLSVVDLKTGEPVEFATVYLIPQGDTVVTNFAITGSDGNCVIDEVTQGKYELNAELVGYKPFKKAVDIKLGDFEREKNLGRIQMEQSREFLDAASVTAAGNPVIIKKDTLVFNANAYQTAENAMLGDLLKKMPGINVASDGTVKVNGESVDRLTVEGKTFFQKDPALAVKSLPAKIVNQVQVVDRAKDDAAFTGVGTKEDQEKVMDIKLKDEYQKGWFGNMKLSGGASLNGEKRAEGVPEALFNSNAMVSHYTPTDQVVLLASAKNATEPGSWEMEEIPDFMMESDDLDVLGSKRGLQTTGQAGVNYNTTRVKGFETTGSASYNYLRKNVGETSARTSFQGDNPDLNTAGSLIGRGTDHTVSLSGEMKKTDNSKTMFVFRPYFMYGSKDRSTSQTSETSSEGVLENATSSAVNSHHNNISTVAELEAGLKDLGKARRSLTLKGEFMVDNTVGTSLESTSTTYKEGSESQDLSYANKNFQIAPELELTYVEPIGDKWSFQARAAGQYSRNTLTKDASNLDGSANDYYSSYSRNDDFMLRQRLLMQYKHGDASLLFGFQLSEEQNVTSARYLGGESEVGRGETIFNWAPYADFYVRKDNVSLRAFYRGSSSTPSGSNITPILDLTNPVQVSTGNIYLRPAFNHSLMGNFSYSNPSTYSFLEVFAGGSLSTSSIVSANWFDANGVRYSVPVNAKDPGVGLNTFLSYNQPFGKSKNWTFSLEGSFSFNSNTGYQTTERLDAIDRTSFDYESFMSWLWGSKSGDRFYSGESGFSESHTNTINVGFYPSLVYKLDRFSATLKGYATTSQTKYSLDPTANMHTWDFNASSELLYNTRNNWQFNTDLGYNFYKGYTAGYGQPELIWNAGIAKDIKAFTVSFKVADILGQSKSLQRITNAEYVEDVHRISLGRYFLVGVVFNFGRMNAAQSSKIERAMWEMAM